ncbi:leishmanolysin-related zinc metalloendopeptidase [Actinomycetospora sp. NBC_00405]|uniref:leishmanolysin-related zinc metalloendopeptidase n=1 Tax=Actinomycetospora sp. NBC_00405 TaxID=2975952 RepID=UPI002E1A0B24
MTDISGSFDIEVEFVGGLSPEQERAFDAAAARWSRIIVADLPSFTVQGRTIDDCSITAQGSVIDGPSGILGEAGPRMWRDDTLLPALGVMRFDTADLIRMEGDGSLENVVFHEMGHVLGLGTLWQEMGLLQDAGSINPTFVGRAAMREFGKLIGADGPRPVPVENKGGPGTRDGHWRETVFGNELMTGILDASENPVSRLTIAAMQDMGYTVSFGNADEFTLPTALDLALMGVGATQHPQGCMMAGSGRRGTGPQVRPVAVEGGAR